MVKRRKLQFGTGFDNGELDETNDNANSTAAERDEIFSSFVSQQQNTSPSYQTSMDVNVHRHSPVIEDEVLSTTSSPLSPQSPSFIDESGEFSGHENQGERHSQYSEELYSFTTDLDDILNEDMTDFLSKNNQKLFEYDVEEEVDDEEDEEFLRLLEVLENDKNSLAPGIRISLQTSALLHITFARRHHLSKAALKDLLALTNLHLRKPNPFPMSVSGLYDVLSINSKKIIKHHYCKICQCLVPEISEGCEKCGTPSIEKGHFVYGDIEDQIRKVCKRKGFKSSLNIVKRLNTTDRITDLYDGLSYQSLIKSGYFQSCCYNLTVQMNTDGVSLFDSSAFSVWPIYMRINELPPILRKLTRYRIIAGLWFGYKKPYMRSFLQPLVKTMKKLTFEGLEVEFFDGSHENIKVAIISGLFDLPAKCLVQETIQFNGYFGCSCCEIEGEKAPSKKKGSTIVFPKRVQEIGTEAPLRSSLRTLAQATVALENKETVTGIRGFSILGELPYFDVIWNIPFDYMHGTFLGVVKTLTKLWFDTCHSKEPWYLGSLSNIIDKSYLSMTPPMELSRLPRSILAHRNYFKANEYRSWLMYYAPIILNGFMKEPYYSHMLLLVKSIHSLQKYEITSKDICEAEKNLSLFVYHMGIIYGKQHCKANIHNVLHYPRQVQINGPLWASQSGFCYEDWNGDFKYNFHGTQKIEQQVLNAINLEQNLPELALNLSEGSAEWMFYSKLTKCLPINNVELRPVGPFHSIEENRENEVTDLIKSSFEPDDLMHIKEFQKLHHAGKTLKSKKYSRSTRRCDDAISYLKDGEEFMARIKCLLQVKDEIFAVISEHKKSRNICGNIDGYEIEINHITCFDEKENTIKVIKVSDITSKKICLKKSKDQFYIIDFLNTHESD